MYGKFVSVLLCRCMFVSWVHLVAVLIITFCMTFSWWSRMKEVTHDTSGGAVSGFGQPLCKLC